MKIAACRYWCIDSYLIRISAKLHNVYDRKADHDRDADYFVLACFCGIYALRNNR